MEITPDIVKSVASEEDDFGHEMRVRHLLSIVPHAQLHHGGTYTDGESGKPRQFDFRLEADSGRGTFALAVEAKRLSRAAPLVICGTNRTSSESIHEVMVSRSDCSGIGDNFTPQAFSFPQRFQNGPYAECDFVGKSMLRLVPKKDSVGKVARLTAGGDTDVYERWAQALSSAQDLCLHAALRNAPTSHQRHPAALSVILPLVVVPDGTLWRLAYSPDGELSGNPALADEIPFYVGRTYRLNAGAPHRHPFTISHLHFVTLTGLREWVTKLAQLAHGNAETAVREWRQKWFPEMLDRIP